MKELTRLSRTTEEYLATVPRSLLYAEVREEAVQGSIAVARMMRASVDQLGVESSYARTATRGAAVVTRGPANPSAHAPVRCMCKYHLAGPPGPMGRGYVKVSGVWVDAT